MTVLVVFLILVLSSTVHSSSFMDRCRSIKKEMPNFRVDKILEGPVPGMCEIWTGNNVVYYMPEQKLLFFGEIWTVKGKSLTQQSRDKILSSRISSLDLSKAIKWGSGKTKVILFTDPDCPFCKRTEKFLLSSLFKDKITVYIYLYPLSIHPHSREHCLTVLASDEPVKTLLQNDWKKVSINEKSEVEKRLDEMIREVKKISPSGLPVTVVGKKIIRGANLPLILSSIENSK